LDTNTYFLFGLLIYGSRRPMAALHGQALCASLVKSQCETLIHST
jgi:hypothetical protein